MTGRPRAGTHAAPFAGTPPTAHGGRPLRYLRLSLTDRCDLRCMYCRPAAEAEPPPAGGEPLSAADLVLIGRAAVAAGAVKIRLTGGEPLLRRDIGAIVAGLRALHGLGGVHLTTNGQRLAALARPLAAAGLTGVNVSLDTLDPAQYARITRGGDLDRCLRGVQAALAAGLQVKLNAVLMRGVNEEQILPLAERFCDLPVALRFIEFMPGAAPRGAPARTVPAAEVLQVLGSRFTLRPVAPEVDGGPALRFLIADRPGRIGIIAPVSGHFCGGCNRVRVTADGRARGCLFGAGERDLRPHLARGDVQGLAAALMEAAADKTGAGTARGRGEGQDFAMSRAGG